jgi:TPR repeat protein
MANWKRLVFMLIVTFVLAVRGQTAAFASPLGEGQTSHDHLDFQSGVQMALKQQQPLADQGNADAQVNLGVFYNSTQDYADAMKWWRKAADQGNAEAQNFVSDMYFDGKGVKQDYVQAYMWINLAAAKGNPDYGEARDAIAKKMTPEQIVEGKRLAAAWKPTAAQPSAPVVDTPAPVTRKPY